MQLVLRAGIGLLKSDIGRGKGDVTLMVQHRGRVAAWNPNCPLYLLLPNTIKKM